MAKRQIVPKITVLVEGENEITYWRKMEFIGVPKKFNLWQAKEKAMQGLLRQIACDEQVIIIADIDVLEEHVRFINNVLQIENHCKLKPWVVFQISNFEDELCFSCNCRLPELFNHFSAIGTDEFKNKLNRENQLNDKLARLNHCVEKMWSRSNQIRENDIITDIDKIKNLIQTNEIFERRMR